MIGVKESPKKCMGYVFSKAFMVGIRWLLWVFRAVGLVLDLSAIYPSRTWPNSPKKPHNHVWVIIVSKVTFLRLQL